MDVTSKIKVVEVFGEKVSGPLPPRILVRNHPDSEDLVVIEYNSEELSVRHKDLSMALGLVDQYWALRKESER